VNFGNRIQHGPGSNVWALLFLRCTVDQHAEMLFSELSTRARIPSAMLKSWTFSVMRLPFGPVNRKRVNVNGAFSLLNLMTSCDVWCDSESINSAVRGGRRF
jgi:hypothetical protein